MSWLTIFALVALGLALGVIGLYVLFIRAVVRGAFGAWR